MRLNYYRRLLARVALLASLALAGCGGGGGELGGVDSGGTGSFAVGTIGGFGSIIVNDIRYDDSRAVVEDAYGQPRSTADLRLGMVVEIEGSLLASAPAGALYAQEGVATEIRFAGEIVGPLQAANSAASQIVVLGQVVDLTPATIYGDELAGGLPTLGTLPTGSILEIHGFPDPTSDGRYRATRVDVRPDAQEYRLLGTVHDHDLGTRRFSIGAARIDYAALSLDEVQRMGVIEGESARVRLGTVPRPDGTWVMLQAESAAPLLPDREDADIEGTVTETSGNVSFAVNGMPVDASQALIEPAAAPVAVGSHVTVSGSINGGVLVAEEVKVKPTATSGAAQERRRITLSGPVAALSLDGLQLRVRGVRVNLAEAVFEGGALTLLQDGVNVQVDGRLALDGSSVDATRIRFSPRGNDEDRVDDEARNAESPANGNPGNGNGDDARNGGNRGNGNGGNGNGNGGNGNSGNGNSGNGNSGNGNSGNGNGGNGGNGNGNSGNGNSGNGNSGNGNGGNGRPGGAPGGAGNGNNRAGLPMILAGFTESMQGAFDERS